MHIFTSNERYFSFFFYKYQFMKVIYDDDIDVIRRETKKNRITRSENLGHLFGDNDTPADSKVRYCVCTYFRCSSFSVYFFLTILSIKIKIIEQQR